MERSREKKHTSTEECWPNYNYSKHPSPDLQVIHPCSSCTNVHVCLRAWNFLRCTVVCSPRVGKTRVNWWMNGRSRARFFFFDCRQLSRRDVSELFTCSATRFLSQPTRPTRPTKKTKQKTPGVKSSASACELLPAWKTIPDPAVTEKDRGGGWFSVRSHRWDRSNRAPPLVYKSPPSKCQSLVSRQRSRHRSARISFGIDESLKPTACEDHVGARFGHPDSATAEQSHIKLHIDFELDLITPCEPLLGRRASVSAQRDGGHGRSCSLLACEMLKSRQRGRTQIEIPLSPTSPLLCAFLISTLDGKMLILSALLQEPSPICPRCRLFIQKNCSAAEYPHSIVPLDSVLVLFCVFPSPPRASETPHW